MENVNYDEILNLRKNDKFTQWINNAEVNKTTAMKEEILKNVEESRIAREASGYKSFIEFESGLGKGVSKAVDINSIKTMLTTGNLDDVYKYINNSSLKSINNDSIDIIFKNIDKGISNPVENVNLKKTIVEKALKDGSKIDTLVPASMDFLDETSGWIKWPPNDGFILDLEKGNRPIKFLDVGEVIDRFGRETGNYVSPKYPTVTYEQRALPYLKCYISNTVLWRWNENRR